MGNQSFTVEQFLQCLKDHQILLADTRSEDEYAHAHIPGAVNLPLLRNEERKTVGTLYKNKGREAAILKGFELVSPRAEEMVETARKMAASESVHLYCWRGGMRSNLMASLLETKGFHTAILKGGYKAFRNWVIETNALPRKVLVLGGGTGSGKTAVLQQLRAAGEQVIDLEQIASHKGSAFGALGLPAQPSHEQFENLLALEWAALDPNRTVWLENESRSIGSCILPANIYALIRNSEMIEMQVNIDQRKERIKKEYGCFPAEILTAIARKIEKRLGPQHLKDAIESLEAGDLDHTILTVLNYYDKTYSHGNEKRTPGTIFTVPLEQTPPEQFAHQILEFARAQKLTTTQS